MNQVWAEKESKKGKVKTTQPIGKRKRRTGARGLKQATLGEYVYRMLIRARQQAGGRCVWGGGGLRSWSQL